MYLCTPGNPKVEPKGSIEKIKLKGCTGAAPVNQLTWQAGNAPGSNMKYIFQMLDFPVSYVSLPEGRWWQLKHFLEFFAPILGGSGSNFTTVIFLKMGGEKPPTRHGLLCLSLWWSCKTSPKTWASDEGWSVEMTSYPGCYVLNTLR